MKGLGEKCKNLEDWGWTEIVLYFKKPESEICRYCIIGNSCARIMKWNCKRSFHKEKPWSYIRNGWMNVNLNVSCWNKILKVFRYHLS